MKQNFTVTILILIVATCIPTPAYAMPVSSCGLGEVNAALQALPVGYYTVDQEFTNIKLAGLGGGVYNCQFRLFWDDRTVTFKSTDYILGGAVMLEQYKDHGLSRLEGITELRKEDVIVRLGPLGDELVEMDLLETTFKDAVRNDQQIVYKGVGFITQLEPGEYINQTEFYYEGEIESVVTVHIIVEP